MNEKEIQETWDKIEDWNNSRQFIYWSQIGTNESEADWA